MAAPYFELITELQTLNRRDFPLADTSILQPFATTPLVEGEWLELDANYKLARGVGLAGASKMATFPVHTERGRYDTQALGKVNVIFLGQYEAETQVVDVTGITLGEGLVVNTLGSGTHTGRRGLVEQGASAANTLVVGYVTKLYSGQSKVRFIHMASVLV